MIIGHLNLAPDFDSAAAGFVLLVEALRDAGAEQHVLVRDAALARRLRLIDGVTVGSVVHSPVMAYCLLPRVDVAHAHELSAGHAGLLMALTRSIPYVLTHRGRPSTSVSPLLQSIYRRASRVLCQDDAELAVLRHWLPGLAADVVPDLERHETAARYLGVYQNSQSMPIAGNKGIQ